MLGRTPRVLLTTASSGSPVPHYVGVGGIGGGQQPLAEVCSEEANSGKWLSLLGDTLSS